MLFRKILLAALLAGLFSGCILGTMQAFITTPIILSAEAYEPTPQTARPQPDEHIHGHGGGWAPHDGFERTFYSMVATVVIACAYALILLSAMSLNERTNWRGGILWGLAGYSVFFVAPSLGLPPEIPGVQTAALENRQVWWLGTIAVTAAGLSILVFTKKLIRLLAIPLLLIPHLLGAPRPIEQGFANKDPTTISALIELETEFFIATALTLAVFWVILGALSGYLSSHYVNRRSEIIQATNLDNQVL